MKRKGNLGRVFFKGRKSVFPLSNRMCLILYRVFKCLLALKYLFKNKTNCMLIYLSHCWFSFFHHRQVYRFTETNAISLLVKWVKKTPLACLYPLFFMRPGVQFLNGSCQGIPSVKETEMYLTTPSETYFDWTFVNNSKAKNLPNTNAGAWGGMFKM